MSVWFCRPALSNWKIEVNIGTGEKNQSSFVTPNSVSDGVSAGTGYILDGDIIVPIDTEKLQESLFEAFNECSWDTGKSFNFNKEDVFRTEEHDKYFDVYVNDKLIAKFFKDRMF